MKTGIVIAILFAVCLGVYWPAKNAEFVLDDYYTVVRNPLIKNPSLYKNIWVSRLFDAHPSSGYIKFGYYRPVLETSWILDYRLFGLSARGYQWLNLLIHALNCFFIYFLWCRLWGQARLALKAALLFCVLPVQEWVVRYVTGRGDELSACFAFLSLIFLTWGLETRSTKWYILVFICWAAAALTREVAVSYFLYGFLIYFYARQNSKDINRFCFWWVLIGISPLLLIWSIILKQGNILAWHVFYFASAGICLWMAQIRWRWFLALLVLFAAASFTQGRFWSTEETLLRHTRSLEWWPRTVVSQELLMKYDDDIPAIQDMVNHSSLPLVKAMWLRRLGVVYFNRRDFPDARKYFSHALSVNPWDVDSLNALAVVDHYQGLEKGSFEALNQALAINPNYPDTLRTLGIYYYIHKDYAKARLFLNRCLLFDPDSAQAHELLLLVNKAH